MKNNNILLGQIFFFFVSMFSPLPSSATVPYVGLVEIPVGAVPAKYYTLIRDGKPVAPLKHKMPVLNGDEIIPQKDKAVILSYIHTDCGKVQITENTTVACLPQKRQNADGYLSILTINTIRFFEQKVKREKLINVNTRVSRGLKGIAAGPQKLNDGECFPADPLYVAAWPLNGTTILNASSVLFRWTRPDIHQCSEVELNICLKSGGNKNCRAISLKVGEMKEVKLPQQDGHDFVWFINKNKQRISEKYEFTILDKNESDNIAKQLEEVRLKYLQEYPLLSQALYLQIISNVTPGLDLYYDSYLILKKSRPSVELYGDVLRNIYDHYWNVYPFKDFNVSVETFEGQNIKYITGEGSLSSGDSFRLMFQAGTKLSAFPFMIDSRGQQINLMDFTRFKQFNAMQLMANESYIIPASEKYLILDDNKGYENIIVLFSARPEHESFDYARLAKIRDPHILNQYLERLGIMMKIINIIHE